MSARLWVARLYDRMEQRWGSGGDEVFLRIQLIIQVLVIVILFSVGMCAEANRPTPGQSTQQNQ